MFLSGFHANAIAAHIRKSGRLDLGLIYSEAPAVAAGVFTTSLVKAAPVLLDRERLRAGRAQAILVNSGIANACTGAAGMALARATAALAARELGIPEELVLVASTGVIGEPLDPAKFEAAMPGLVRGLAPDGFAAVSRAIMTTDTVPKTAVREGLVGGRPVRLLGLAKGAGMIMPNMATMLAFIATDAAVEAATLERLLGEGADRSFNRVTVDGDTSTNDSVLILANGRAGNPEVNGADPRGCAEFGALLAELMEELALMIAADGEGATKLVTIRVTGAADAREADLAARTVANSPLVKTAFFGEDANWGRIIAALGRSGASFDPDRVDIAFDDAPMVRNGLGLGREAEKAATAVLKQKRFTVRVDLNNGPAATEVHTCDLSLDYIKINADYRT